MIEVISDKDVKIRTSQSLFWGMENDEFKGTPEQYLIFKRLNKLANKPENDKF